MRAESPGHRFEGASPHLREKTYLDLSGYPFPKPHKVCPFFSLIHKEQTFKSKRFICVLNMCHASCVRLTDAGFIIPPVISELRRWIVFFQMLVIHVFIKKLFISFFFRVTDTITTMKVAKPSANAPWWAPTLKRAPLPTLGKVTWMSFTPRTAPITW